MSETAKDGGKEKKKGMGMVLWIVVPLFAAGGGFASSQFMFPKPEEHEVLEESLAPPTAEASSFIPLESLTVNLNDPRMTRYLNVVMTLQVRTSEEEEVRELLESHRPVLRTWLISYLSELTTDDIKGTAGVNRVRREIQAQFNSVLFSDGFDHIYDVFFEQFNTQ